MVSSHKRQSNIELLRIAAILMVIVLHYLNGSMGGYSSTLRLDRLITI